jgi:hypothetical protein
LKAAIYGQASKVLETTFFARFILYLFQGDGVDDPRRSFREARGVEGATC